MPVITTSAYCKSCLDVSRCDVGVFLAYIAEELHHTITKDTCVCFGGKKIEQGLIIIFSKS